MGWCGSRSTIRRRGWSALAGLPERPPGRYYPRGRRQQERQRPCSGRHRLVGQPAGRGKARYRGIRSCPVQLNNVVILPCRSPKLTVVAPELPMRSQVSSLTVLTWRVCAALDRSNTDVAHCGIGYRVLAAWSRENSASGGATASYGARAARSLGTKASRQRLVLRAPVLR